MVKITLIDDEIDEETGKKKKVKLRISFWSVIKMYLIGWFIITGIIAIAVLLVRLYFGNII